MSEKQCELFDDLPPVREMETEDEKSSGLSIPPYLAVKGEKKQQTAAQLKPSSSYKDLSKDQIFYLKNEAKFSYRKFKEDFEKRNGYPLSWHQLDLQSIAYRERGEISYFMEVAPHILTIRKKMYLPPSKKTYARKSITDYSLKSRKRFFEALLMMDWEEMNEDTIRELTLTYPAIYPNDGKILKLQFDAFAKRLKRFGQNYGELAFVWKMEFQKRGAPHYHLIILTRFPIPLDVLRSWALDSWSSMVAKWINKQKEYTPEEKLDAIKKHQQAGIEADKVRKSTGGLVCYLAWYIGKGKGQAKAAQHVVPKEFQNVGRWWGFYGKRTGLLRKKRETAMLTQEQYESLKDTIVATWAADGRRYNVNEAKMSLYSFAANKKKESA